MTRAILREIRILTAVEHPNVMTLNNIVLSQDDKGIVLNLITDLMDKDLAMTMKHLPLGRLTETTCQMAFYEILCGIDYLHDNNVLHRDLKPGNILIGHGFHCKIADFGLARALPHSCFEQVAGYTTDIITQWYRAPELLFGLEFYTAAVDCWSVGCILAEMVGGKPIFRGKNPYDQLAEIIKLVPVPSDDVLDTLLTEYAKSFLKNLMCKAGEAKKKSLKEMYPHVSADCIDLIQSLLTFDHHTRFTVKQALAHPFVQQGKKALDSYHAASSTVTGRSSGIAGEKLQPKDVKSEAKMQKQELQLELFKNLLSFHPADGTPKNTGCLG